ncbi:hypothetical protein R1sor_015894 [Riccia sorocarpa]|uniref:Protein unc-13 homolog n=1 Tax=Riccia sorocarpa TaxID=122646 RepID=A0ABD3HHJ1_9MARC
MAPNAPDQLLRALSLSDAPVESPFPELEIDLSEDDLRETAYEILVAACGYSALSARTQTKPRAGFHTVSALTHRGLRKAALALGSKRDRPIHPASKDKKRPPTTGEIVQYQMRIDEESETRIRRALLRAFSQQVGKPVECMLVPLELLQFIGPKDFTNPAHYDRWKKRQLRVLESGLLVYPAIRSEGGDETLSQRVQKMLDELQSNSEISKNSEEWNAFKIAAVAKAGQSTSGDHPSSKLHWADGYPLNVHLYLALLLSTFDTLEEGQLIDEIDEVLEMFKKTWGILGINEVLHDLCFMWVLFNQFVAAGQIETDLLLTAQEHMKELAALVNNHVVVNGAQAVKDSLTTIHSWCERRLLAYHEIFPRGAPGVMEAILSIGLSAGRILAEGAHQGATKRKAKDLSSFESDKVELYIRSSLKAAFAQMMETTDTRRRSFKNGGVQRPPLAVLATDIGQLAADERAKYTPVLKNWNVCAGGIAAATLHACFGREVSQFVTGLKQVGPDVLQVLKAAQQLEEVLVQIAVEDAVDAEDGGKSLMREMQPYDCESSIEKLSKEWLLGALVNLVEWVGRNVEHEDWRPKNTREGRYAESAVEILSIIDETMEAFFGLPFSSNPQYVEQLVSGVESAIQLYCQKTLAGSGKKERYVPSLPPLTRYNSSAFKKIGQQLQKNKVVTPGDSAANDSPRNEELALICVRINTLHHLSTEMQYLGKRLKQGWRNEAPSRGELQSGQSAAQSMTFMDLAKELDKGVQDLIEIASYRVAFFDLRSVFWEGLYAGGVKEARIDNVIEQLDSQLQVVAETVAPSLRNRVVGALMKSSMDCLVLVLLAGGPSRAFSLDDADLLQEDLFLLTELFTAGGDGLPEELVTSATAQIQGVLSLFSLKTADLIERLREVYPEADTGSTSLFKSNAAIVPRTTGNWGPTEPNTVFRVLSYRGDEEAGKYLKKTFNLPKKVAAPKRE